MHSDKPYDSICTVKTTKVLVTQGNGNQARQAFKSAFLEENNTALQIKKKKVSKKSSHKSKTSSWCKT